MIVILAIVIAAVFVVAVCASFAVPFLVLREEPRDEHADRLGIGGGGFIHIEGDN